MSSVITAIGVRSGVAVGWPSYYASAAWAMLYRRDASAWLSCLWHTDCRFTRLHGVGVDIRPGGPRRLTVVARHVREVR